MAFGAELKADGKMPLISAPVAVGGVGGGTAACKSVRFLATTPAVGPLSGKMSHCPAARRVSILTGTADEKAGHVAVCACCA